MTTARRAPLDFDEARVERTRLSLQDTATPDLVDAARMAQREYTTARKVLGVVEGELSRRAEEKGAVLLIGGDTEAELAHGATSYAWDGEAVAALLTKHGIDPFAGLVERVTPASYLKVNTSKVLAKARQLGIFAEMEALFRVEQGAPSWKFRERKESK